MAIKTNAELTAQNNAAIRVNGNREITPPKHNEINKNIFDSYLNIKDGGQVVQVEAGYSTALTPTNPTSFVYKSWVENLVSSLGTYLGLWDANTNTPTITSGVGTNGDWYYVSVAGTTTIDGISTWAVGDKIIFNGTAWERITSFVDLSLGVTGILPVANGGTGQSDYTLRDNTNEYSLDWANRNLFDAAGDLSIDYNNKKLWNGTANVIDYATGRLKDLTGVGVNSIDFNIRELYNNTGATTADYGNRFLYYGTGQVAYDWNNNILLYTNGNPSINAAGGTIYDTTGNITIDYLNNEFYKNWSFLSGTELRFNDNDNSNYVGIKAPTNVTSNYTISLPSAPPSSGQYLGYNGSSYVWNTITSGLTYLGTWNANTNTPTITSGVGSNGEYYIVSVAGTTTIDGINDWGVGDWIMFNGTAWQKIDNSDRVSSVDGMTGAVSLASSYVSLSGSYANPTWITSLAWSKITGTPTTRAGYGITDAQPLATNLTSLAALSYVSTSFVKMTAAGTFALDTNTYATASGLSAYYLPVYNGTNLINSTIQLSNYGTSTQFFNLPERTFLRYQTNDNLYALYVEKNNTGFQYYTQIIAAQSGALDIEMNKAAYGTTALRSTPFNVLNQSGQAYSLYLQTNDKNSTEQALVGVNNGTMHIGRSARSGAAAPTTDYGTGIYSTVYPASVNTYDKSFGMFFRLIDVANNKGGIQWYIQGTKLMTLKEGGNLDLVGTEQNMLTVANGIKIGNNTDTAATAGGGSFKYSGGIFYGSDGSSWNAFLTASNLKTQSKTTDIADITAGGALSGNAYWIKITADNSGDVDRIGCFVTSAAAENIYLGIYSNAGSKLADATVSSGSVVAGINTATLSSTVSLVAGTQYWLCIKDNNTGAVNLGYQTCLTNSNICKSLFVGAGSLPANDTGASAANAAYHIFVFKS